MNYIPYLMVIVSFLVLCWLYWDERHNRIVATKRWAAAANAYAELSAQSQEREAALRKSLCEARRDAANLAAVVRQYLADIDVTAVLLKDQQRPAMTDERLALSHHEQLIKQPLP